MICLFDLGHEYWKNWYATQSGVKAYELTLERIQWYSREYPRLIVCADSPVSKRKEIEPTYKANREKKPPEAIDSLVSVEERIRAWGVPVVKCEGFEADDVIKTICDQAWPENVEIISVDKDLMSLISETVCCIGKQGRFGANECYDKYGVAPALMSDWIALVGDASDGIKGCDSCGPKRAADLLNRFGSIKAIKDATDEELRAVEGVGPKTVASIREWDPALAMQLVQLTDAPVRLEDLFKEKQ